MLYIFAIYCKVYQYEAKFKSNNGEFDIQWENNFEMETIKIQVCYFNNDIQSNIWMGIGFSDHGEMENADMFVVNILSNKAKDMHTTGIGQLQSDFETNYKILEISNYHRQSCFTLSRYWNSCDKYDYNIDKGTTNILLFASRIKSLILDGVFLKNLSPIVQYLQLIRSTIPINNVESDTPYFDILVDEMEILNAETTYWCKVVKLPYLTKKNHIIKYQAIITDASLGIVHHMELFHCTESPSYDMINYNAPCNSESKPMGLTMCRKVIAAWAMGAGPFTYPKDVGNPIGGSSFSRFAILEIHYNNPQKLSGIIDNSGMRLFYTHQIRKFDAGIIELGLEYNEKNSIPPGQEQFVLSGYCVENCLSMALPTNGIFVFGSQLHTHLTGVKVETRHFRLKKELEPLNSDIHYQPHYQEIRLLPEIVNILKGDSLVTSCTYKTVNKTKMTFGGISITDEMCLNYIFYYPRINLELCKSSVSDLALELFLGSSLINIRKTFKEIVWTKNNVALLSQLYRNTPIHQSCNMSDSKSYPGHWNFIQPTSMLPRNDKGATETCANEEVFNS